MLALSSVKESSSLDGGSSPKWRASEYLGEFIFILKKGTQLTGAPIGNSCGISAVSDIVQRRQVLGCSSEILGVEEYIVWRGEYG